MNVRAIALLGLLGLACAPLAGCGGSSAHAADVPPPIEDCDDPYACATRQGLADRAPDQETDDLHNVYRLSETIITGGEPLTPKALERVAALGVKTVLSVDGKVPDAETAQKLGMRYVHVPIRYSGITKSELTKIAKTFRELEGPFYVHCFHGKHRGPAAAAVGRVLVDGVSRETAIAEMKLCGTAAKYVGLYQTIATGDIPGAEATAKYDFAFDAAQPFDGVRLAMVRLTRSFDELRAAKKRAWAVDPDHPDISAKNEAEKVLQHFEQLSTDAQLKDRADDYRAWMKKTLGANRALVEALSGDEIDTAAADAQVAVMKDLCGKCHTPYRNR